MLLRGLTALTGTLTSCGQLAEDVESDGEREAGHSLMQRKVAPVQSPDNTQRIAVPCAKQVVANTDELLR